MPFTYSTCCITTLTKHIGNSRLFGTNDHSGISSRNPRVIPPPSIMPRKQRIARRRTGRSHRMRIRKTDTLGCQAFHIRRMDRFWSVATQVTITDIIGYQENNVRLLLLLCYFFFRLLSVSRTGGQQGSSYSQYDCWFHDNKLTVNW